MASGVRLCTKIRPEDAGESGDRKNKGGGISPHRLRDAFAVRAVKTNDSGDGLRLYVLSYPIVTFKP